MAAAPLHKRLALPRTWPNRAFFLVYSGAIFSLLYHHSLTLLRSPNAVSLSLFVADLIFAFMWVTYQGFRMAPVRREVYPQNLTKETSFPAMDVFICTADPYKEPPMRVVNTALSVMAYDYPTEKMSLYVSDDGGSQLTLFAIMEASKFAAHWLAYCKKNALVERCPEAYFATDHAWFPETAEVKNMYESMKMRVEKVVERGSVPSEYITDEQQHQAFSKWTAGFTSQDHPTVLQVLLESGKDKDIKGQPMPNLIYIAREKSSTTHHNFKAGALNVLIRVSAAMTNSPIILTLDCDMYSNDPQTPLRAMCFHLDSSADSKVSDPWCYMYVFLFFGAYAQDFLEFVLAGGTIRRWWNCQRMWIIRGISSFAFGFGEFVLEAAGLPTSGFNVTNKVVDADKGKRYEQGIFDFGVASPMYLPLTMGAFINLIALVRGISQVYFNGGFEDLFLQLFLAGFGVINSLPVYEAMALRTDYGKIPVTITLATLVLASGLCYASSLVFLET
ncbi:cellulose synthase like G3 [Actinidia rufa]|uniref:Cellulose synthase like G3 n=1 Tax=Actinidia rufa TaxID=165716 RepID=A0A7J0DLY7_9ERIC|nr:cellulose synthase like G3 [Actinidia rufa]